LFGGCLCLLGDGMICAAQLSPLEKGNSSGDEKADDGEPLTKDAMLFAAACIFAVSLVLLRKGINKSGGGGALAEEFKEIMIGQSGETEPHVDREC
jgi:hypothetical protein